MAVFPLKRKAFVGKKTFQVKKGLFGTASQRPNPIRSRCLLFG